MNAFDPRIILISTYMSSFEDNFRSQILRPISYVNLKPSGPLPCPSNGSEKIRAEDRVRTAFSPMLI